MTGNDEWSPPPPLATADEPFVAVVSDTAGVHCGTAFQLLGVSFPRIGVEVPLRTVGCTDEEGGEMGNDGYDRAVYRRATSAAARALCRAPSASLAAEADKYDISA